MNIVKIGTLGALGLFLILPVDLAAQGRARGHDKQEEREEPASPSQKCHSRATPPSSEERRRSHPTRRSSGRGGSRSG